MARTPILRQFEQLVCSSLRTDACASREMSSLPPTRRAFLGTAAAAATMALAPGTVRASMSIRTMSRIAVVGAGLAGLTCALRLQQRGIHATVYEASTRLGGRCWTRRGDFASGQVAEHGGELIDQSHTATRQLAQELGLDLVNALRTEDNGVEPRFWFGGAAYPYRQASLDLRDIWRSMHRDLSEASYPTTYLVNTRRGRELDAMSIAQWIEATVPGGRTSPLGQLLDVAYTIEYGAGIEEQSSLNLLYLLGYSGPGRFRVFGPSNEKYRVVGGNDQMVARMAALLAGQVEVGHRLVAVRRAPDARIVLTFATPGGTLEQTFDHVVFALPFAVLDASVDLSQSGFSARKRLAIAELGRGANSKLNVQFGSRVWNAAHCSGETYTDRGSQTSWEVTRGQSGTQGILVNYSGGSYARGFSGADPVSRAIQFCGQVEPLMPGVTAAFNGLATLDTWHDNPMSLCSYSFWKVGQYTTIAGVEGEREDNAYYCGEHTSIDAQGYLEGAVETGERAAAEVAEMLRG